jgi:hypothetical protein
LGALREQSVQEYAWPAIAGIVAWALIAGTDNPFDYYAPFTQYIGFLCAATVAMAHFTGAALRKASEGELPLSQGAV